MINIQRNSMLKQVDEDIEIDELPLTLKYKTVLGDIFHFMDRANLLMYHEFKALFFQGFKDVSFYHEQ